MNKFKICILIICTTILLTACDADKTRPIVSMYDQGHTTSDCFVTPTVHYDVTSEKESYSYLLQLCALNSREPYYEYYDNKEEADMRRKAFQIQFSAWLDSIEFDGEYTKEQMKDCFENDSDMEQFSEVLSSVGEPTRGGLSERWKWTFVTCYGDEGQYCNDIQKAFLFHLFEVLAPGELEAYLPVYYAENNRWNTEDGHQTWIKMHRFEGLLKLAKEPFFGNRTKDLIEKTETRLKDFTVIDSDEEPKHSYSHSSGSSYSSGSYGYSGDPYGAEDYDDPEDFADEWEDDFDDWDDAYDYWEDWDN